MLWWVRLTLDQAGGGLVQAPEAVEACAIAKCELP